MQDKPCYLTTSIQSLPTILIEELLILVVRLTTSGIEREHIQVFNIKVEPTCTICIVHKQENPKYVNIQHINIENGMDSECLTILLVDDGEYMTMMLEEEY